MLQEQRSSLAFSASASPQYRPQTQSQVSSAAFAVPFAVFQLRLCNV